MFETRKGQKGTIEERRDEMREGKRKQGGGTRREVKGLRGHGEEERAKRKAKEEIKDFRRKER